MLRKFLVVLAVAAVAAVVVLPASAKTAPVTVTAGKPSEFRFTIAKKALKTIKHGTVVFKIVNKGTIPHDFKIAGKRTKLIQPGKSALLRVVFKKAGKYPYLCTVSGHAAAGMKGVLRVR